MVHVITCNFVSLIVLLVVVAYERSLQSVLTKCLCATSIALATKHVSFLVSFSELSFPFGLTVSLDI